MTMRMKASRCRGLVLMSLLAVVGTALAQHPAAPGGGGGAHPGAGGHPGTGVAAGAHQHFDSRFSHNQYYYDRGYGVHTPPAGGMGDLRGRDGERYYFHGGNWYRWRGGWYRWWGGAWVVWGPPIGLFVPFLPPLYTTIWWGGIPYYYANDAYYVWNDGRNQYEVVTPPEGLDAAGTTPSPVTEGASEQLYAYPLKGQSAEQQSQDRYECHRWAVEQSGFDPTSAAAAPTTDKRSAYFRAQSACLEGRGYSVK